MQLIEGDTLSDAFEHSLIEPFTSADHMRSIKITGHILDLLGYLDAQEHCCLCQRILTPRNIIVDCNDRIKIVDFGIPEIFLPRECSFNLIPIEQYPDNTTETSLQKDEKADICAIIYALGGILYTLLTGETPCAAADRVGTDVLKKPTELNETIYPAMETVIVKALALMPQDRYQSVDDIKKDLGKCLPKLCVRPEEALNLDFVDYDKSLFTLEILNEAPGSLPIEGYVHSDIPGIRMEPDRFINDEKIEVFALPGTGEPGVRKGTVKVITNVEKKLIPFSFSYLMNNPELLVTPAAIALGTIPPHARTERIVLENKAGASLPLHGTLSADESFVELSLHEFYGNSIVVEVTIKVNECTPGPHESTIRVESSGGTKEITVSFATEVPESPPGHVESPSESSAEVKAEPVDSLTASALEVESEPAVSYTEAAHKITSENPPPGTHEKKKSLPSSGAKQTRTVAYSACALLLILCTASILIFGPLFRHVTPPPPKETLFEFVQKGDVKGLGHVLDTWPALINVRDSEGQSLVHVAVACSRPEAATLALLIAHKADINSKTEYAGDTPLHTAAMLGHTEYAKILIEKGASVDMKDAILGQTPLHRACLYGHSNMAALLLDNNADINATDDVYGDTPLHKAALKGYGDIVELLVSRGANIHKCDREGLSAIDVARKYEKEQEVNILRGVD